MENKNWKIKYYDKNDKLISSFLIENRTEHEAQNEAMGDIPNNCEDWTMMPESIKKDYYRQDNIGKCKYTVSFHNGIDKHKDGSKFYSIKIFKNKPSLFKFINKLKKEGYVMK